MATSSCELCTDNASRNSTVINETYESLYDVIEDDWLESDKTGISKISEVMSSQNSYDNSEISAGVSKSNMLKNNTVKSGSSPASIDKDQTSENHRTTKLRCFTFTNWKILSLVACFIAIIFIVIALVIGIIVVQQMTSSNLVMDKNISCYHEDGNSAYQLPNIPSDIVECINLVISSNSIQDLKNFSQCFEYLYSYNNFFKNFLSELVDQFTPYFIRSCKDVYQLSPNLPPGYYWVRAANNSVIMVYCEMSTVCGNRNGGWMRVANLNVTSTMDCPSPWGFYPKQFGCGTSSTECNLPAIVHTNTINFTQVCGRIIGNISGTIDGVDSSYVHAYFGFDGIGLTLRGSDDIIWSFIAGHGQGLQSCPCMNSIITIPQASQNKYFCSVNEGETWNGAICHSHSSCCDPVRRYNPPWFYSDLVNSTSDDLAITICRNEDQNNENVVVQVMELYVQ